MMLITITDLIDFARCETIQVNQLYGIIIHVAHVFKYSL